MHPSKFVIFNFQKTQYHVTVSILYSRVGSQEPLIRKADNLILMCVETQKKVVLINSVINTVSQ